MGWCGPSQLAAMKYDQMQIEASNKSKNKL